MTRVLKALRAHKENPDIFQAACARLSLWLSVEEADALRARAAAPKRARPRQTRAAARDERLGAARASFSPAIAKRQTSGPAPTHAAWRAYRAKAVAEQRRARRSSTPRPHDGTGARLRRSRQRRKWTTPRLASSQPLRRVHCLAEVVSPRSVGHVPQLQHLASAGLDCQMLRRRGARGHHSTLGLQDLQARLAQTLRPAARRCPRAAARSERGRCCSAASVGL